jgi:hypothetical protein
MGWEIVLLSSFLPAVMDSFKHLSEGLTRKFVGRSVEDEIRIAQADVDRVRALAELDSPVGTPSQWVIDLRAAFRYISAIVLILAGLALAAYGASHKESFLISSGLGLAAAPFSFIFGERLYLPMMGKAK